MTPDFSKMTYSEFCVWITENDAKVEYVLQYENWSVVKIDKKYYYYEHEIEGSSDLFYEVKAIAKLHYTAENDIQTDAPLHSLFACCVCGEQVLDDEIIYWWFKENKSKGETSYAKNDSYRED